LKRSKYITIQEPVNTITATGGSRNTSWSVFWSGWAEVLESTYQTAMEESQWTGNKAVQVNIRKNGKTDNITTSMRMIYRDKQYLINSVRELDRFTLELMAKIKIV
jgi:SPP1 family predicted phage head-tail adaptor